MNKWVKVYNSSLEHQAGIVMSMLESNGCTPILINKKDSSYNNFGNYEIFVKPSEEITAINLIDEHIRFQ